MQPSLYIDVIKMYLRGGEKIFMLKIQVVATAPTVSRLEKDSFMRFQSQGHLQGYIIKKN